MGLQSRGNIVILCGFVLTREAGICISALRDRSFTWPGNVLGLVLLVFELCCLLNNYSERRDMLYDFESLIAMAHLVCTIMPEVRWLKAETKI